jgi:hypothetical protein
VDAQVCLVRPIFLPGFTGSGKTLSMKGTGFSPYVDRTESEGMVFSTSRPKSYPQGLLITAKLMSGSVCFEPISKSALYQGTTSVVPKKASRTRALSPCGAISLSVRLRPAFGSSTCEEDITFAAFNKAHCSCFLYVRAEARTLRTRDFFRSLCSRLITSWRYLTWENADAHCNRIRHPWQPHRV